MASHLQVLEGGADGLRVVHLGLGLPHPLSVELEAAVLPRALQQVVPLRGPGAPTPDAQVHLCQVLACQPVLGSNNALFVCDFFAVLVLQSASANVTTVLFNQCPYQCLLFCLLALFGRCFFLQNTQALLYMRDSCRKSQQGSYSHNACSGGGGENEEKICESLPPSMKYNVQRKN